MLLAGNNAFRRTLLLVPLLVLIAFAVSTTAARAADPYTVESDIAYGPANDQPGSNLLDVYVPNAASATPRPVFVWIHGGGWFTGDKVSSTMAFKAKTLVDAGFVFVSVNYRLNRGDFAPWPAAVDDVAAALAWVRGHGSEVGLGTTRIVTAGHSAGGTLATLVALASNSDDPVYAGSDAVDGWIDIAGINDFSTVHGGFWGSLWSAELDQLSARMSPTRFVDAQDPPGYVIHGDDDGLVPASHSLALKDEADRRGARVSLDVVDAWSDQAWMPDRFRNHVPTGGVNVDALNRFLDGL